MFLKFGDLGIKMLEKNKTVFTFIEEYIRDNPTSFTQFIFIFGEFIDSHINHMVYVDYATESQFNFDSDILFNPSKHKKK